jgi:MFS family permease
MSMQTDQNALLPRQEGVYPWLVVAMLWLVCLLNYADRQAIFSVFSVLKEELHISDLQLGVVAGCFMWAYAVFGPVAGWITDFVSRSRVVVAALCFWSIVTGATAYAHNYPTLLLLRTFGGLGEAFYFPAAISLIAAYHGQATRSRAMAVHQSSVYVGTIVGGSLSASIAERFGWRLGFQTLGAAGILLALILLVALRDPAPPPIVSSNKSSVPDLARDILALLKLKDVMVMIAVFVGANFVAVVVLVWMPTLLLRKFNMHLAGAGFNSTMYIQGASVAGVIAGGFLADFARSKTTGGRQLVQAIGLLGGVPFLFFTGYSVTVGALLLSMTGFGLFKGLYDANIWASLYDFVPVEQRGLATGLMNSLGWLGGGFAPIAVAVASAHYSLSVCISMTAAVYLVLVLPMGIIARPSSRTERSPSVSLPA